MGNGKLLTVVVPAYNAEDYLRKNLRSLCIREVLQDIEILVINDGSTDHTQEIAEKFAGEYPQSFQLINKENGGHGSGINCGIREAAGTYFKVVDADDWVDETAFKQLVQALKEQTASDHPADIVSSGFLWAMEQVKKGKTRFKLKAEMQEPFRGVEYGQVYPFDEVADRLYIKMHHMTIRTQILRDHEIRIDEHCYYVDSEYITYPIPWVDTVCFVDAFVYRYRIGRRGQSVGIERMRQNEKNYDQVLSSLLRFYRSLDEKPACSAAKKRYIAGIIARVAAGKIKVMLSFPLSKDRRRKLLAFDEGLREQCPDIYHSNRNQAVRFLRGSRYMLYLPASVLVRLKYR